MSLHQPEFIVTPYADSVMSGTKIYALLDADDGEFGPGAIRYIGRAEDALHRLKFHWYVRNDRGQRHRPVYQWMSALDMPPVMSILEVVEHGDAGYAENSWIRRAWREFGWGQICNRTMNGHIIVTGPRASEISKAKWTPELRQEASERAKVQWANPDHREMIVAANSDPVDYVIRKWVVEHGFKLGQQGYIPVAALRAYREAHKA